MANIQSLRSYLVSLGFQVNNAQLSQFNNAIQSAAKVVNTNTKNIASDIMKWQGVVVGMFEAIGVSAVLTADKVAMADQQYRLFGQRMFMTTDNAKSLKIALDALEQPLEAIAFDPELHSRFDQLETLQRQLQFQLGGASFAVTMREIRDASFEFTRFRVEALYFTQLMVKEVFQALGGVNFTEQLRALNAYIVQHIPEWSRIFTTYIVPVLRDAWMIFQDLLIVGKDFARLFTNIVGLFSGDPALQGQVSFEKFAKALQTVSHWLAVVLDLLFQIQGVLIGSVAGGALGAVIGGAAGAAGGPLGMLAGAGTGGLIGMGVGAAGGGVFDLIRHGWHGADVGAVGSDDVRTLAQQVGGQLGVDPSIVYAQWAHETGGFTNRGARSLNNLAGIRLPGSNEYRSFSSLNDFGNYYAGLIQRRYPGAVGAGSIDQYAGALKAGGYFEDSLTNYERGMHSFEGSYGAGVTIGSINIMQPNATPDQIVTAISTAIDQKQKSETSMHLNELKALYG